MPIETGRLLDSDLFALSSGDEFKAAVALWCKAWQQVPAASLPDDDRILACLSGAGEIWRKVRGQALRGFVRCTDGRLYHPVIADKALQAWAHRQAQRAKINARWGRHRKSVDTPVHTAVLQGRETAKGKGTGNNRAAANGGEKTYTPPAAADLKFPQGTTQRDHQALLAIAKEHRLGREQLQLAFDEVDDRIDRSERVDNVVGLTKSIAKQILAGTFSGARAERQAQKTRGGGRPLSRAEIEVVRKLKVVT